MRESMRVAANTGTFSAPFAVSVEAVKAAGFTGLEVWKSDLDALSAGAGSAAFILRQAGLGVTAFQLLRDYEGCGADRSERLTEAEELMGLMADIGAQTLLICANTDPTSSGDQDQQIRDLQLIADIAQTRDIQIGFEPLAWSKWIYDYEKAWACVEAVDRQNFGLVLDVFHLFSRGSSLSVLDKITMDKLFVVQLCNAVTMSLPAIEIARHHRLFPSDGEWPVADVVQRIEKLGFRGDYSIEVFNDQFKKLNPYEVARLAMLSFRQLFHTDEIMAEGSELAIQV